MKTFSIAFLRIATGLMLVIWGVIRLGSPEAGSGVAEKYYGGLASAQSLQTAWGAALLIVGILCVIGLFRKYAFLAQAVVLVGGALAIWKYLLDPLGLYLLNEETRQVLFFPSLALAAATLVLIAFLDDDELNIDTLIARKKAVV